MISLDFTFFWLVDKRKNLVKRVSPDFTFNFEDNKKKNFIGLVSLRLTLIIWFILGLLLKRKIY